MHRFIYLAMVVFTLVGCASMKYGNFSDAPAVYDQTMATDTVKQLMVLYPPAMTYIDLQQSTDDAYGKALVTALRAQGYAISEYKRNSQSKNKSSQSKQHLDYSTKLPFGYVVDQQEDTNLYHVKVTIGDELLTRLYVAQNKQLLPAGSWVYKER